MGNKLFFGRERSRLLFSPILVPIKAQPPLEKVNIINIESSIPGLSKRAKVNNSLEVILHAVKSPSQSNPRF